MRVEKCKNCSYYIAYYKRLSSNYGKLNHGFCRKNQTKQKHLDTCENFRSSADLEKSREKRLFASLEWALKSVNDISQILKEKEKEKKDFIP